MGGGQFGAKKEVSCKSATCLGQNKVSCIRVNMENHVAFVKMNFGIGIGGNKIKEPVDFRFGEFSGCSLGSRDFIQSRKNGGIHGTAVVKERSIGRLENLFCPVGEKHQVEGHMNH